MSDKILATTHNSYPAYLIFAGIKIVNYIVVLKNFGDDAALCDYIHL